MKILDLSGLERRSRKLWQGVVITGLIVIMVSLTGLPRPDGLQFWQFTTLAIVTLLSARLAFAMPRAVGLISPADAFVFLIGLLFGAPTAALIGGLAGFAAVRRLQRPTREAIFNGCLQTIAVLAAFTVFYALLNRTQIVPAASLAESAGAIFALERTLFSALALVLVHFGITSTLTAAFYGWQRGEAVSELWIHNHLWSSLHLFVSGFAAILVSLLVNSYGPVYLLAIAPVVAAGVATCRIYFDKVETADRHMIEMRRLHLATAEALAIAIDAKDQTTHAHVRRVQMYATTLGRHFDLTEAEIEALRAGALLHDVGKLAVPDYILNKPGKLTPAEFEKMKVHTVVGAQMMERVGFPYPVAPIVRYHHERWDGRGYPEGLQGEQIPITARILSVVDCFDAVREDRPYHRGMPREQARQLLLGRRGRDYDPQVVDAFLDLLPAMEAEIAAELGLDDPEAIYAPRAATAPEARSAAGTEAAPETGESHYLSQIKSAHNEIFSLYEIARTFGSSLNLEDIMAIFANKLRHIVPFDTCAIFLCNEDEATARVERVAGDNAEAFLGKTISPGAGVTGWVLANRQMFGNADPALDLRALQLSAGDYRTMTALPLIKDERVLGVISLYASGMERYTNDHLRLLDTISGIAADSFHNALHHATTAEYALTDPLTQLPNSRALDIQFRREANRAIRQNAPCCVLMMDLDGFKSVNDTHGHQAGDELISSISRTILAELRSYDFLARQGGDEFVALLPGISEDALEELTGRIVHAVENFRLPGRERASASVGVSIGAARYPGEGTTLDRLLRIADRRMYKNKNLRKQSFFIAAGESGAQILQTQSG